MTAAFGVITNYSNTLLQITAVITNYDVITNYVVTIFNQETRITFYYILSRAAPKDRRTFSLDKPFSCYIVAKMFVTSGIFFIIST